MDNRRKDHSYPSDITREQFEIIRPILESAKKKTKPRVLDLYDVFCGVLYRKFINVSDLFCLITCLLSGSEERATPF